MTTPDHDSLDTLLCSLTLEQSWAVSDIHRSDNPGLVGWLHGLDVARDIAEMSGGGFPVPFAYWEEYGNDPEKPRTFFFAVLGTPEEAERKIRERLAKLPGGGEAITMTTANPPTPPASRCADCGRRLDRPWDPDCESKIRHPDPTPAQVAVEEIEEDLGSLPHVGTAWKEMDEDYRDLVRDHWAEIIGRQVGVPVREEQR